MGASGTRPALPLSMDSDGREPLMPKTLKPGDKVGWGISGGETHGTVEKKATSTTQVKGHTAKATKEEPQFVVKSAKSGKTAVHKPGDLKKKRPPHPGWDFVWNRGMIVAMP